jgi:hypothetical protein
MERIKIHNLINNDEKKENIIDFFLKYNTNVEYTQQKAQQAVIVINLKKNIESKDVKKVSKKAPKKATTQKKYKRYCQTCGCVGTFTHLCTMTDHKKICFNCNKVHKKLLFQKCSIVNNK